MNPGYCGFFDDDPEWVDETDHQHYCNVVPTDGGACFMDDQQISPDRWIESDMMISLGDAR